MKKKFSEGLAFLLLVCYSEDMGKIHPTPYTPPTSYGEWLDTYLLDWPAPAVIVAPWLIPVATFDFFLVPFRWAGKKIVGG